MEAVLDAPSNNHVCHSVAALDETVRHLLATKTSESRAEHISATFELPSTVWFTVPTGDADGDASRSPSALSLPNAPDPSHQAPNSVQGTKQISASDTLFNQPHDNPVLQRTVAKYLIGVLAALDLAHWIMREVSRDAQGWTFVYICKDSSQAWLRQNAKRQPKTAVGEWSGKDGQDPIHLSRPAFDCRGYVNISFSQFRRCVDIKYEHTPLHKTVSQLLELLAPPPPPLTEATPKTPVVPKGSKTPSSRRKSALSGTNNGTDSEGSSRKRRKVSTHDGDGSGSRRRSEKKAAEGPVTSHAEVVPPEMPGALPVQNFSQRSLYSTQPEESTQDQLALGSSSSYPEGLVGPSSGASTSQEPTNSSGDHPQADLNIPAAELERRAAAARQLLLDHEIDPQTLSSDQFHVFANQAPDLQKESLEMLVKYGAERLRIVHPVKEASAGPASEGSQPVSTETTQPLSDSTMPPATTDPAAGSPQPGCTEQTSHDGGRAATVVASDTVAARPRLARASCQFCRNRKAKCDKVLPACQRCVELGLDCFYPPPKPRKSKATQPVEIASDQEEYPTEQPPILQEDVSADAPRSGSVVTEPNSSSLHPPVVPESDLVTPSYPLDLVYPPQEQAMTTQQAWSQHYEREATRTGAPENSETSEVISHDVSESVPLPYSHNSSMTPNPSVSETQEATSVASLRSELLAPSNSRSRQSLAWSANASPRPSTTAKNDSPQLSSAQQSSPRSAYQRTPQGLQSSQNTARRSTKPSPPVRNASPLAASAPVMSSDNPRQSARSHSRQSVRGAAVVQNPQGPTGNSHTNSAYSTTNNPSATNLQSNSRASYSSADTYSSAPDATFGPAAVGSANPYSSMHAYNTRRQDPSTAAVPAASTVSQAGSPSYAASVSSGAPQWGPSASSQSRRSIPYNSAHTGSVANYHVASAGGSESPNLQPFHVRPQSEHYRGHMSSNSNNSTGGSSDNAYGTQHAQAQGQPTAYVPYQSQSQASPSSGQWYGLGGRSSHPASSGYGTGTQNGASTGYPNGSGQDGYGHYSAQQQSMNLSGHTYSSLDGDSQTIYNLLRGDPGN